MTLYKFRTFTTSYYFPKTAIETQYLYKIYSAFGGKLVKVYWWLFKKNVFFRSLHIVKTKNISFPYQQITELEGNNSLMSFNMGSPGVEQKISILGYNQKEKKPFFAKFSQKKAAMELSKNEINILEILQNTGLVPCLYDKLITDNYVFFKTECIAGDRLDSFEITEELFILFIRLSQFHLSEKTERIEGLQSCLAHGDFCPWNVLKQEKVIRLIDWEMASDRPLGFDLFTYIFQTTFLLSANIPAGQILDKNLKFIKRYFDTFGVIDFKPYLKYFIAYKLQKEKEKKNHFLYERYYELNNML